MGKRLRMAGRLLAIGSLAVLLSGCLKFTEDLTINEDNTVDGEVTMAVSQELIGMTGSTVDEVLASMASEPPVPEGVEHERSDYDDGEFVGYTYSWSNATIEQMNSMGEGGFTIERVGDNFQVSGTADATSSDVDPNDPAVQAMLDTFELRLSITFPGKVSEADENAEVDGNTVTWKPELGQSWTIRAVGSATPSGGGIVMWLLIGAAVVVILVVAFFLMSKRGAPVPAAAAGEPMTGFDPSSASPAAEPGMPGGAPAPPGPPAPPVETDTGTPGAGAEGTGGAGGPDPTSPV